MIKKFIRKILHKLFTRNFDDIKIQKGQLFEKYLNSNIERPRYTGLSIKKR